jgi:DNA modification methylase
MPIFLHDVVKLPITRIREAPWNANKVGKKMLEKIRHSLSEYGSVENSVVRPAWCVGARTMQEIANRRAMLMGEPEFFETLSGNHRLRIYREEHVETVPCVVVEEPDARAKVLAQVLNRTRGEIDDPDKLKALLKDALADLEAVEITKFLPHSERDLLKILRPDDGADDELPEERDGPPDSQPGQVYVLGPHRLLCGDSTDRGAVEAFIGRDIPGVMVADPPYGVELDQGWRDHISGATQRKAPGTAQTDRIEGDDGFDWVPALGIVDVPCAYLWHASAHDVEARAALESFGFEIAQQIVWVKDNHALSRQDYHWKHEPCAYAVKRGRPRPWYGSRNQTTVWLAPSPKQNIGSTEDKWGHPTQKPCAIFEPPVFNHLAPGEFAYDPFAGSGTLMAACEKAGRRALMVEKKPKYCDLIRRRYSKLATAKNIDPGPGGLL